MYFLTFIFQIQEKSSSNCTFILFFFCNIVVHKSNVGVKSASLKKQDIYMDMWNEGRCTIIWHISHYESLPLVWAHFNSIKRCLVIDFCLCEVTLLSEI